MLWPSSGEVLVLGLDGALRRGRGDMARSTSASHQLDTVLASFFVCFTYIVHLQMRVLSSPTGEVAGRLRRVEADHAGSLL